MVKQVDVLQEGRLLRQNLSKMRPLPSREKFSSTTQSEIVSSTTHPSILNLSAGTRSDASLPESKKSKKD
jgi:hypothetical protein